MLFMCRPPSILQFPKILGSLAKTNHCPTAISLFQQLQSRIFKSDFQPYTVTLTTIIKALCLCDAKKMEKKREIVELYRERLDNTLASPHMTNYHMLKNLVQTQLLHSSKQQEFYQGEGADSLSQAHLDPLDWGRTEFGFQRWEWLMVDEVQNDQTVTA
ncbi:Pentatricopeptide repeat-containing protein [Arachis hypogaea]|uniref:Pentatricopeptide repeat-containing protein n=1 Tax=Arachis hypogaea TaxID=3818 RepID=A0A6B9VEP0_ARAHY|nr:Pentatricopeptide repeat-containing protein [Arachis hypogaea]